MSSPAIRAVDVRFDNVTYEVPPTKTTRQRLRRLLPTADPTSLPAPTRILHGISGHVRAGESLAILGPSGSGKTTLLNLLAARSARPPVAGRVLFAGRERVPRTKRHIGYVMQDDVFFSQLTVRETLEFTADIRLGGKVGGEEKRRRVADVMERLRLVKCAETRIGDQQFDKGISGGERKRVNIANELLHDPSLLLADECTSGLDSSSAYTVINLLRELCNEGRTVIATIHQPSSQMFLLFDKIMLLAAGRVAYFGPPARAVEYFESIGFPFPTAAYNPADYMLELVIDDRATDQKGQPSVQTRILEAWEARSGELLSSDDDRKMRRRPLVATTPASGGGEEHVAINVSSDAEGEKKVESKGAIDYSHRDGAHAHSSDDHSSSLDLESEEPPTTLPAERPDAAMLSDPPGARSWLGRIARASKKRARDVAGQHGKSGEPDKYPTNWFTQVRVLARRAFRQKRGTLIEPVYVAQVFFVTLIASLAWFRIDFQESTIDDRLGALSFFCIFWAFYSTFSALFAFPAEKRVLNKDRAGGSYRLSAYYFAKTMIETPADTLYPITFAVFVYYIIGLNPSFVSFLLFTIILTVNVIAAQSIGLLISALLMDVRQAQVLGSVWILSSMLLSGYYIDPENTPEFVEPIRAISFIRYSYEAMVRAEMLNQEIPCSEESGVRTVYSATGCPITSDRLLEGAQLSGSLSIGANIAVLLAFIVITRAMGYFALKVAHTSHKPRSSSWRS